MFSEESLSDYLGRHKENLRREIKSNTDITKISLKKYEESLIKKYSIEVPVLDEEGMKFDTSEEFDDRFDRTKYYELLIPFKGSKHIFSMTPSTHNFNRPYGEIFDTQIKIKIRVDGTRAQELKREIKNNLEKIKQYLEWAQSDVEKHNEWVRKNACNLIQTSYDERTKDHELFLSLGFRKKEKKIEPISILENDAPIESFEYDAFICHASEDKEDFVDNLAEKLIDEGLKIWYDDFSLSIGDSLRRSIDKGLKNSKYGVVILSKHFFEKEWPQKELDGLSQMEVKGRKVILPIWHDVEQSDVVEYSPMLADKIAVKSKEGLKRVVESILQAIKNISTQTN